MNTAANALITNAEARVNTCRIYANRAAIVGCNTVVVSTITLARGVHTANIDGVERHVVTMFPNGMPTCFTPSDAAQLAADFNADAEERGIEERVYCMNQQEWWEAQLAEAERALNYLRELVGVDPHHGGPGPTNGI